jgi:hypothetical protein
VAIGLTSTSGGRMTRTTLVVCLVRFADSVRRSMKNESPILVVALALPSLCGPRRPP